MKRRTLLKLIAASPVSDLWALLTSLAIEPTASQKIASSETPTSTPPAPAPRVRPTDPNWPSASEWESLNQQVGGSLVKIESPLAICKSASDSKECHELIANLQNPYFIGDNPALTQTSGWIDAWVSTPSAYAVAAHSAQDIVAAVNFARAKDLRLVVRGGAHSYKGGSNAPDSLMIWTRALNGIKLHDSFLAQGADNNEQPQSAVSLGAGVMWIDAYDAVTTKAGRYVQGGGCATVGVVGLIHGGGFGSFSKHYGLAAASLLEAEIVTADGELRVVNKYREPDLFWAIKGMEETLTVHKLGLQGDLKRILSSTNTIESMFSMSRRYKRNVKHWKKNTNHIERTLVVTLMEAEKRFRRVRGYRELKDLKLRIQKLRATTCNTKVA